ncbi:DUF1643 domain-containing protein [Acinetobacter baumannii]
MKKNQYLPFVALNPPTADHEQDDRTIRRCINFTEVWGRWWHLYG